MRSAPPRAYQGAVYLAPSAFIRRGLNFFGHGGVTLTDADVGKKANRAGDTYTCAPLHRRPTPRHSSSGPPLLILPWMLLFVFFGALQIRLRKAEVVGLTLVQAVFA